MSSTNQCDFFDPPPDIVTSAIPDQNLSAVRQGQTGITKQAAKQQEFRKLQKEATNRLTTANPSRRKSIFQFFTGKDYIDDDGVRQRKRSIIGKIFETKTSQQKQNLYLEKETADRSRAASGTSVKFTPESNSINSNLPNQFRKASILKNPTNKRDTSNFPNQTKVDLDAIAKSAQVQNYQIGLADLNDDSENSKDNKTNSSQMTDNSNQGHTIGTATAVNYQKQCSNVSGVYAKQASDESGLYVKNRSKTAGSNVSFQEVGAVKNLGFELDEEEEEQEDPKISKNTRARILTHGESSGFPIMVVGLTYVFCKNVHHFYGMIKLCPPPFSSLTEPSEAVSYHQNPSEDNEESL